MSRAVAAKPASLEEYEADRLAQDVVEHNLQLMIQACIDLALHALAEAARPVPEESREAFPALAQMGILDRELGLRLARMASLRNAMVHLYLDLDRAQVYAALDHLDDVRQYVAAMSRHLGFPE